MVPDLRQRRHAVMNSVYFDTVNAILGVIIIIICWIFLW